MTYLTHDERKNTNFTLDFSDLKTEVFLKDVFTLVQLLQSVLVGFVLGLNHYKTSIKDISNNKPLSVVTITCSKLS